jgi:hypothetical protein
MIVQTIDRQKQAGGTVQTTTRDASGRDHWQWHDQRQFHHPTRRLGTDHRHQRGERKMRGTGQSSGPACDAQEVMARCLTLPFSRKNWRSKAWV